VPVDPLDLFRGYYAHLNYDISRVYASEAKVEKLDFRRGEYVYATLAREPNGKFYKVIAINRKRPLCKRGEVVMKGRLCDFYDRNIGKILVHTEGGRIEEIEQPWGLNNAVGEEVVIYLSDDGQVVNAFRKTEGFTPPKGRKIEYGKVIKARVRKDTELIIKYGIESYFVEEARSSVISEIQNKKNLYAEISVGKDARALISRIFIDGKPL
jgi:uncharacterized membrane-anchored protein